MEKSKILQNKTKRKFNYYHKKSISREKNKRIQNKFYDLYTINSQLQKYNCNPLKKNIMIINDIIETKSNHFLAIFKDYLITDYIDEFLKRYFIVNESEELIPKFYDYYQNYLKFFCRGFFTDFQVNKIIQDYGECQAELYYNKNYGTKSKNEKKNKSDNYNLSKNISNSNSKFNNKKKLLFTEKIRNSINRIENSKLISNYIYKFNTNEISNIFYKNKNETITLNNDTKIYNDNLISKENSIIKIIDAMIHRKREKKKSNINNINNKNIINIYKNLLNQSPIKSARNLHYNKNIWTTRKVSSIKIFNKNIPSTKNSKSHLKNINSNDIKDMVKTPNYVGIQKILLNNYQNKSRNLKSNNSNLFMKSNLTQRGYNRNTSKSISSRIGGIGRNFVITKNNKKLSPYNTNVNINANNQNTKKKQFNGLKSKNINNVILSISSSRNLKKNSYENTQLNKNNNHNNQRNNTNRIKHYQYISYKNKNQYKHKNNYKNKYKQNSSTTNSNSIFNNYHININNNIMLYNNNNNMTHYNSSKNYLKSNSKKKKNENIKLTLNKPNKSRNVRIGNGIDLKKYKTETKNVYNINKSKKNLCSSLRKYIYLVKYKNKSKDKINKIKICFQEIKVIFVIIILVLE